MRTWTDVDCRRYRPPALYHSFAPACRRRAEHVIRHRLHSLRRVIVNGKCIFQRALRIRVQRGREIHDELCALGLAEGIEAVAQLRPGGGRLRGDRHWPDGDARESAAIVWDYHVMRTVC